METPKSHERKSPEFTGDYRKFKDGTVAAVFRFFDDPAKDQEIGREVLYDKNNLEKTIANLKLTGQPFAHYEQALANWPK